MPPFYKRFARVRTAPNAILFVMCLSLFCMAVPRHVLAEPYIVEGVEVDVSAENAIKARDQAFAKAQQDAFKKLAAQFLDEPTLVSFTSPSDGALSSMIRDYEVTKEKLSSTRYVATYTFTFKQRAVDSFFGQIKAPTQTDIQSVDGQDGIANEIQSPRDTQQNYPGSIVNNTALRPGLLVLPFINTGSEMILWSPRNVWMQAWNRAKLDSSLLIPVGDISDITDIRDNQAYGFDAEKMHRMLVRYGAREAVIVIAKPNLNLLTAVSDTAPAQGEIQVDILRTDRPGGAQPASAIAISAMPGETRGMFFNRAVVAVQRTLAGDWKNNSGAQFVAQAPPTTPMPIQPGADKIPVRFRFASLQEWARVRNNLRRVPGVRDVVLTSLAPREARIAIDYNGDVNALRIALMQSGLSLSQDLASNIYDLSGAAPPPQMVPSYEPASGGAYRNRF